MENESDGPLPFLDILLSREEDGSISTSVHHKATHTDQDLCFHSHHPAAYKRASIVLVKVPNQYQKVRIVWYTRRTIAVLLLSFECSWAQLAVSF